MNWFETNILLIFSISTFYNFDISHLHSDGRIFACARIKTLTHDFTRIFISDILSFEQYLGLTLSHLPSCRTCSFCRRKIYQKTGWLTSFGWSFAKDNSKGTNSQLEQADLQTDRFLWSWPSSYGRSTLGSPWNWLSWGKDPPAPCWGFSQRIVLEKSISTGH